MRTTRPHGRQVVLGGRGRLVLAGAAGALLIVATSLVGQAADQPTLDELELTIKGGYIAPQLLGVDTDGDGWCDWYELLRGTDPTDPKSHPGTTVLDVVGTTAFVQGVEFPDRLAMIDLALPEGTTKIEDLLDVVGTVAGLSPTGKLHRQLDEALSELAGSGRLADMVSQMNSAFSDDPEFTPMTNGMAVNLISSSPDSEGWIKQVMEDVKFVQEHSFESGTSTDGDPFISVRGSEESQTHIIKGNGDVESITFRHVAQDDGSTVTHWSTFTNGKLTGYGKRVKYADGTQVDVSYDADGNEVDRYTSKPTSGSTGGATGGSTSAPASTSSGDPTATADPPGDGGSAPSSDASPSTYVNPDSDEAGTPRTPTQEEIEARVAFLAGVRTRVIGTKPEVDTTQLLPKPGVADPADPVCEKSGCMFFVEVSAPRMSNVNGGDPVPPDLLP